MMKSNQDSDIRFAEADKRVATIEKRIEDVKWLIGSLTGLLTVVFSVMLLAISWNYGNEKAALRDFQRDLREDLGKAQPTPKIEILGSNRQPLSGQDVEGAIDTDKDGIHFLTFRNILRNTGNGPSGPMYIKVYTKGNLPLASPSSDESKYSYESYFSPKDIEPNDIPGSFSTDRIASLNLVNNAIPPLGRHPILLKVYFGKNRVAQSEFNVILTKKP